MLFRPLFRSEPLVYSNEGAEDTEFVQDEESVLVLTNDNFDSVVNKHETILVEFYAPWCGHCKSLAPEYAAAAAALLENDPPVALGKVDATVHTELAQRFEVQGYPTLRFFKNGKDYEYDGPRFKDGIVEFMQKIAKPDWAPEPEAVITLTKDDFDEVTENEEIMIVEFYAPWCGHCKRLAPIYEKAAKQMKKNDPPVIFAKVDATKDSELASRFGVTGYPTLKIFKKGRPFEYKGERNSEYDFISAVTKYMGDGAKEIFSLKMLKDVFPPDDITVVGFFQNAEDPGIQSYKDVADELRDDYKFGITFDEASRKAYKVNPGSVVVFNAERFYTKFEAKWHVLSVKDDTTVAEVKRFVESHQVPLVGHYAKDQVKRYDTLRPLCLVFYTVNFSFDYRDVTQMWRNKIAAIAKNYPDITFAVADDEEYANLMIDFGLGDSGEEMNFGLIGSDGKKYGMEPMEEFDSEAISEFLDSFKKGKLKPFIKSQRAPKKQSGPVTVVVGNTFEQIVKDSKKDVLIELYAPWCGHCKKLEPAYAALAKKLKKEKNLVIAKMDATANDMPDEYKAEGFPTIYFAPSNKKDQPLKYDGGREVDDFEKYLKKHATVSFSNAAKEEL
ncbi:protein disulfide-isomerase A4 isoform X3 [Aplysia californica]|uniref:Protein disulfide-isomerase n=1 Tax=Aplysia californica TaxID=6500 RepID=A0ABM0JQX8_APLCA|nr:protein disulfide-isomerase A4 isoform X3 [Aplysia californica]